MLYITVVAIATVLISLASFAVGGIHDAWALALSLFGTLFAVAAVFAVDGVLAFVARQLPERWFSPDSPLFSVSERERRLYRALGIKGWKKYIPEWGCFTGFHKDRVRSTSDSAYLGRFLLESNYGVLGHLAGGLLGFLIILIPNIRPLSVGLPVAAVNLVLNLRPTALLRYNTPSLRHLYHRALDRESGGDPAGEKQ